jgi:Fungal specific transcription factor domain
MHEPDPSLPYQDQEERRRTFWSIYLLDSLATCGRARPPMLRDYSCKLHLPSTEASFRDGQCNLSSDIDQALNKEDDHGNLLNLAPFARVIVTVTILGRCAQYVLQGLNLRSEKPPWDAGSDYASINSSLLDFESRAKLHRPLQEVFAEHCVISDHLDRYSAEHLVFSYALYHLSQCLLNHHFLLRRRLINYAAKVPLTFSSHISVTCREHAQQLTRLMENARNLGCELRSSFFGYCALIAGTINALHQYSTHEHIRQESMLGLAMNTLFLQNHVQYWKNAELMVSDSSQKDSTHMS